MRLSTPWGAAQTIKTLAPGILLVSTASHGGLMLDSAALLALPEHLRTAGETYGDWRCFEEDCVCGLVYEARIGSRVGRRHSESHFRQRTEHKRLQPA
jgi:hypothetical protein